MAEKPTIAAVADTSFLIGLLLINHLELLPRLFSKIIVPRAVWDELRGWTEPDGS